MTASAKAQSSAERVRWQNVVLAWTSLLFLLFPVFAALGIFMRAYQSGLLPKSDPAWFYTALTLQDWAWSACGIRPHLPGWRIWHRATCG